VSIQGRGEFIDTSFDQSTSSINSFFQPTRRKIGETFLLHPNQTVLATTLEYIKVPNDVGMTLLSRSSYNRLGLNLSSIVQPGYCGCISIEMVNYSNNTIRLVVGSRLIQASLYWTSKTNYLYKDRKYFCSVRPETSLANEEKDIEILHEIYKTDNNIR
jgi:dCTP deaminase